MVSIPIPTVLCAVCGSPEWVAVRPGTAADATPWPDAKILPLFRCEAIPTVAWCEIHEPLRHAPKPKRNITQRGETR